MKKLAVLLSVALALPLAAHARHNFLAFLSGYQEVPSVSTGADAVFQARSNAENTAFEYVLIFEGLQGNVTQAHIHFAQKAVNGPIVVWLCGTPGATAGPAGTQTCPASGTIRGTITADNVLASPATQQLGAGEIGEIINAMRAGAAYVNIHTSISPGGEIRGQVLPW